MQVAAFLTRGGVIKQGPAITPTSFACANCGHAGIVGELFFMHEFQTVIGGSLFDVNPFGQPGVEAGKNATYALMGREGYEDPRTELEAIPTDDSHRLLP